MPWGTSGRQRAILGVGLSLPPYFETGSPIIHSHISQVSYGVSSRRFYSPPPITKSWLRLQICGKAPGFLWILEIHTLVLTLGWQALYPLNHLFPAKIFGFETESYYLAQVRLDLFIFWAQFPKCWDYKHALHASHKTICIYINYIQLIHLEILQRTWNFIH